jgi:hypothetical protein
LFERERDGIFKRIVRVYSLGLKSVKCSRDNLCYNVLLSITLDDTRGAKDATTAWFLIGIVMPCSRDA